MDVRVGDILTMKKPHPCGEKRWVVERVGMDFRMRCLGCGREIFTPRSKIEPHIRKIEREEGTAPSGSEREESTHSGQNLS